MAAFLPFLVLFVTSIPIDNVGGSNHIYPPDEVAYKVSLRMEQSVSEIRKRPLIFPFRIRTHFDSSIRSLSEKRRFVIKTIVFGNVILYWSHTLKSRQNRGTFFKHRQCIGNPVYVSRPDGSTEMRCKHGCKRITRCGPVVVPDKHLDQCELSNGTVVRNQKRGSGVRDMHIIIYVTMTTDSRCSDGKTLGTANVCQMENALDRPVAGYVNLCPNLKIDTTEDIRTLKATVNHELVHVFGFSYSQFAFFRDANGDPISPRNKYGMPVIDPVTGGYVIGQSVVKTVKRYNWMASKGKVRKNITLIATRNVLREVRNLFDCHELEGAELEDLGGTGTRLSHWEIRVFQNELMTANNKMPAPVSRITLALLHDTGWYSVDYNQADEFLWGKNLGCDFVQTSPMEWVASRSHRKLDLYPFCNRKFAESDEKDSGDRPAVTICDMVDKTSFTGSVIV